MTMQHVGMSSQVTRAAARGQQASCGAHHSWSDHEHSPDAPASNALMAVCWKGSILKGNSRAGGPACAAGGLSEPSTSGGHATSCVHDFPSHSTRFPPTGRAATLMGSMCRQCVSMVPSVCVPWRHGGHVWQGRHLSSASLGALADDEPGSSLKLRPLPTASGAFLLAAVSRSMLVWP
jgi:hypothetical protein